MEEQKTTARSEQSHPVSIAEALNTGMKTMSSLVAKYTAAVLASQKTANGQAKSGTEDPSPRK